MKRFGKIFSGFIQERRARNVVDTPPNVSIPSLLEFTEQKLTIFIERAMEKSFTT